MKPKAGGGMPGRPGRAEEEILELLMHTAEADDRIRAVILNGSRANSRAPRDPFQDFDVVFFVTDVAAFAEDTRWIERFGEMMILQIPEAMQDPLPDMAAGFAYLMQLADGNRIDLGIYPLSQLAWRARDSLTKILLDKDGRLPERAQPDDRDYLPLPPTPKQFANCCNEFWWVCPYVAKGLWRRQPVYAHAMLEEVLRQQLLTMLYWHSGVRTGFLVNPGFKGKYLQDCLSVEEWQLLMQTYTDAHADNMWQALFAMGKLFRQAALSVAGALELAYPHLEDERVTAHLHHVHRLPHDAERIY
jgi:aminoglycoside 6-adenylyltransferase